MLGLPPTKETKKKNREDQAFVAIVGIYKRFIECSAKCRHLNKAAWKESLRQIFICSRSPPLLGFCLGVVQQFSRFCIWSDTQFLTVYALQNNETHTPLLHTVPVLIFTGKLVWIDDLGTRK
jgi:hypothetical protein